MKSAARNLLAAVLSAGFAASSFADMLFDNGRFTIRLTTAPCTLPPVAALLSGAVNGGLSFAATVTLPSRTLAACWGFAPNQQIILVDEDGEGAQVPSDTFKAVS